MPTDIKLRDDEVRVLGPLVVEGGLVLKLPTLVAPGVAGPDTEVNVGEALDKLPLVQELAERLAQLEQVRNWNVQGGWRACYKCALLYHEGGPGLCAADGRPHERGASGNYHLPHTRSRHGGQPDWRWCKDCQGLFHAPSGTGRCPGGGGHDVGGTNYFVVAENSPRDFIGQNQWRWCRKCSGLHYAGGLPSVCAAGDAHDGSSSGDYVLDVR